MALFIAMEASSFFLESTLVLFSVGAINSGECRKIDIHRVVRTCVCVMVRSSIVSVMCMSSVLVLLLLTGCLPFILLLAMSHHDFISDVRLEFHLGGVYPFIK